MDNRIIKFEKDAGRLSGIAEKRRADGDIVGAVSAYRSALEKTPMDYRANAGLAELYTEADLCAEALNCWYRALASAEDEYERARAYNGLGANYYFLAKDILAVNYFSNQLENDPFSDYEYNDVIEEIQQNSLPEPPRFYVAYDKKTDTAALEKISRARSLSDAGKFNEALCLLTEIKEDSPAFKEALELIAFILLLQSKFDTAIEIAEHILYLDGENFTARYVMCSGLHNIKEYEKSEAYYKLLTSENYTDERKNLHMIMITLDTGHDADALRYVNKILAVTPYNLNVLYVRGLVKYNIGDVDGCIEDFRKVLVFTDNAVVRAKLSEARKPTGERKPRLEYEFDLNESEVKYRLEELNNRFNGITDGEAITFADIKEHCNCVVKCKFSDLFPVAMHMGLAVDAAAMHTYLKTLLLDVSVSDELKCIILKEYLSMGLTMPIKCVTAHVYREFNLSPIELSGYSAELFTEAYNLAAANLYAIAPEKVLLLKRRMKKFMENYECNGGSDNAEPTPVAAAMFHLLKINLVSAKGVVCGIFNVESAALDAAIDLLTNKETK